MTVRHRSPGALISLVLFILVLAWFGSPEPLTAGGKIKVNSANPPEAEQGTINLDVEISGENFEPGSVAKFFLSGTTNPGGITVNSTAFVNSATLRANIDVADDAEIALFDIVVLAGRRRGKGTELFAVKQKGKPNEDPPPPPDPAIAFLAESNWSKLDLMVVNADGSNQTLLLEGKAGRGNKPSKANDEPN